MDLSFTFENQKFNYRVCAVILSGNRILAMHDERSPYYYLPGGRVTMGETAEHAVLRELREETGLIAEPERVRLLSSEKGDRFFFDNYLYLCPEREPKLTLQPEEVVDACFVELSEVDAWKDRLCPPAWGRWERDREAIEAAAAACHAACS